MLHQIKAHQLHNDLGQYQLCYVLQKIVEIKDFLRLLSDFTVLFMADFNHTNLYDCSLLKQNHTNLSDYSLLNKVILASLTFYRSNNIILASLTIYCLKNHTQLSDYSLLNKIILTL